MSSFRVDGWKAGEDVCVDRADWTSCTVSTSCLLLAGLGGQTAAHKGQQPSGGSSPFLLHLAIRY